MTRLPRFALLAAPLLLLACGGGTTPDDAATDSSTDARPDASADATDARADAPSDVTDAHADTASDASSDASSDATDAGTDVPPADTGPACDNDAGLVACNGACVDLRTDDGHCGACDHACAANERCASSACGPVCRIGGAIYAAGAPDPANPCHACDPAMSGTDWTPLADGSVCGAGMVCNADACTAGCFVAESFSATGALDPANDCRACDPAATTTDFSTRPDNSVCGTAQYCTAGACGSTWHALPPTGLTAMYGGTAAASQDGRVYLFGGVPSSSPSPIMQIYNPATHAFTRGPDVPYTSYRACAVTAPNGRIYIMGGSPNGSQLATVVIYDPVSATYTTGPSMPHPADEAGCSLGADGRIYVFTVPPAATPGALFTTAYTMILDPVAGTWTTGAPMPTPRQRPTAVTLPDGRIAVTGGDRGYIPGAASNLNELYDPATNAWSAGAPMPTLNYWNLAALRPDGRMLITNGLPFAGGWTDTFVYDPALDSWAAGLPTNAGHYAGYIARTPDGHIYALTGRQMGGGLTSAVEALY